MEQTTDYGKFKAIVSNREVHTGHVNQLVKAITKKNLLHLNPILCNNALEVIDGQHRLEAAQILQVPIFYVIDGDISKADIADINSNSRNWGIMDYINYWAIEKAPGFDKLCSYIAENPLIQPSTALMLLSSDNSRNTNELKAGRVNILDYNMAVAVASVLKYYRNYIDFAYERNFVLAVATLMNHPEFDLEIMKTKVDLQPRSLVKCINKKQYLEMLLEIYNYKSSKNRISF